MKVTRDPLDAAAEAGIINPPQPNALYRFLQAHPAQAAAFNLTQALYYLGGLMSIGAMTLLMGLGWQSFGSRALVAITQIYAVIGLLPGNHFRRRAYHIAAGLTATFVVAVTSAALFGLMQATAWWPADLQARLPMQDMRWRQSAWASFIRGSSGNATRRR